MKFIEDGMHMNKIQCYFIPFIISFACNQSPSNLPSDKPITPQAIYSKDDPGNWVGREDEHTPVVEIISNSGSENIIVSVTLQNPSPSHYIEKLFIADSKGIPYAERIYESNLGSANKAPPSGGVPGAHSTSPEEPPFPEVPGEIIANGKNRTWRARFTMPLDDNAKKNFAVYARCSQHDLWKVGLLVNK